MASSLTIRRGIMAGSAGLLLLCGGLSTVAPAKVHAASVSSTPNTIQVSAGADVQVAPNMATVSLGVTIDSDTAQDAQDRANRVIAAAVGNLHALHIVDRDIQTSNVSLSPRTDSNGNVIGYEASDTLAITLRGTSMVGKVIDAGVAAHANNNVSVSYGLLDDNAVRDQALVKAVGLARTRAQAVAAALGRSLTGAKVTVIEGNNNPGPITYTGVMRSVAANAPAQAPTQTFGGLLTVHEDVTLTYTF